MREILFRGKKLGAKGWAYGVPVFKDDDCFIVEDLFKCDEYLCRGAEHSEVKAKTIGQYTGLKDKNGKRIFEGDILQTGTIKGNVVWDEKRVEYCFLWKDYGKRTDVLKSPNLASFMLGRNIEIIGTIHDNPELLEVT